MQLERSSLKLLVLALTALSLVGCSSQDELTRLREENERLKAQLTELSRQTLPETRFTPIPDFTVGLAAAEKSFDEGAFSSLLQDSLRAATDETSRFSVAVEDEERQIAKVRGMLVQQYLGEQKVPVKISNLTYKLSNASHAFKVGGAVVPATAVKADSLEDGTVRCSYAGPLLATMARDGQGQYSIKYEDTSGREGQIPVTIRDVEVFDPDQAPQAARQGEVALNWQLSLEKIQVYRINDFSGDLGRFVHLMRYPRRQASMNQYQTIRDSVFLFGYGPYTTGLLNRISTPSYIDEVEVMALSAESFASLEPGITESELDQRLRLAAGKWVDCKFVEFSGEEKIWERPVSVSFPFVSRQRSKDKGLVFYTKYDVNGSALIGDYTARSQ